MNRHLWLLVTGCAWAVMMHQLFEREVRPYFDYHRPPTYRAMLHDKKLAEVQRRTILANTVPIGQAESLLEPLPEGGFRTRSRMQMNKSDFSPIPVFMSNETTVDADFKLVEMHLQTRVLGQPIQIRARRQGEKLHVRYEILALRDDMLFDFPSDATLSDDFLPFQGGVKLSQGKKWKMKMLDGSKLISLDRKKKLELSDVYATVVERDSVEFPARRPPPWKVEVRREPTEEVPAYTIWVDDAGVVLQHRQMINKKPLTIVLDEQRRLTPDEAAAHAWKVEAPR